MTGELPDQSEPASGPTDLAEKYEPAVARIGITAAFAAYLIWGLSIIFYKWLAHVPAVEVIAHRIVWSVILVGAYLVWRGRFGEVRAALANRKTASVLLLTSILISFNWGVFVWAIAQARIVEAALGYFMLPLVTVAIGFVLLGERLNGPQKIAVGLALVAIVAQTWEIGTLPWVAVALALLFAFYGFARKTISVGAQAGLFIEVALLCLPAIAYIVYLETQRTGHFFQDSQTSFLLIMNGPLTAIPLILYAEAVRRLRLVTVGLIFYMTPTIQFLIGTFVYGEPVSEFRLATFVAIWIALLIFITDSILAERRRKKSNVNVV